MYGRELQQRQGPPQWRPVPSQHRSRRYNKGHLIGAGNFRGGRNITKSPPPSLTWWAWADLGRYRPWDVLEQSAKYSAPCTAYTGHQVCGCMGQNEKRRLLFYSAWTMSLHFSCANSLHSSYPSPPSSRFPPVGDSCHFCHTTTVSSAQQHQRPTDLRLCSEK